MSVGLLNTNGLLALFSKVAGQKLIGVVDGMGVVEFVLDDTGGGNLVCIYTSHGPHTGRISLGGVDDPVGYVRACGWREAA